MKYFMKKILLILTLILTSWMSYEALDIWSVLDSQENTIGRLLLYDRNGGILADLPKSWGYSRSYKWSFDVWLIESIIQIEDKRFFKHYGIDTLGKFWAIRENYQAGKTVRGWSTITEQYIKNRYFPDAPRTIPQKMREGFWAIIAETKYSKEEILKKYLDSIYMGNGIYGIQWALDIYFPSEKISTLKDSSRLEIIARIKYPNITLGAEAYKSLLEEKLSITPSYESIPKREKLEFTNIFPFLTDRIKNEITSYCISLDNSLQNFIIQVPIDLCKSNDITLVTSIDMGISQYAANVLEATLFPLEEKNVHNGSIYIWSEKEKKVLAYIGNRLNTRESAVDMIVRKRSVGSVLKPFIYELALERWWSPESLILDETRVYETANDTISYVPQNYIPKAYGPISLGEALWNSLNSATVRLSEKIGIGRIYERFRNIGFDLEHEAGYYGYSISLGGVELSLENTITWYRSLLDIGKQEKFLIYDMLSNASNRARTFGISSILNTSIPFAVKTGTSTDFKDNWAIGYNSEIIIGVWVGNTNHESMDDISWVTGAGPIYHALAEELIVRGYIRPINPPLPEGINSSFLCMDTKCLQKETTLIRNGSERKSRPKSNLYYKEDFITDMTLEEIEKWKIR